MAEFDSIEDKALLYALGEMTANEAREFEREMDESPELAGRVRELEEGAVALALSCQPQRAPNNAWKNIERAIESERRIVALPWEWLRDKGWAAAAACLVGWLIYVVFVAHSAHENSPLNVGGANIGAGQGGRDVTVNRERSGERNPVQMANQEKDGKRERSDKDLDKSSIELLTLQKQVGSLQGQLAQISQTLTQQQALLTDPTRLKFIGLSPATEGASGTNGVSPQLQHAISLAMARELGWLGNSNILSSPIGQDLSRSAVTNIGGVDFIDLRTQQSATNLSAPANLKQPLDLAQPAESNPGPGGEVSPKPAGLLPAFASNDHVTVALDNSVAPPGSQVIVSTFEMNGGAAQVIGTISIGSNPVAVTFGLGNDDETVPRLFHGNSGWGLVVTSITPDGATNQMQFVPRFLNGE